MALLRNDVINFNMQFSLRLLSLVFQAAAISSSSNRSTVPLQDSRPKKPKFVA